ERLVALVGASPAATGSADNAGDSWRSSATGGVAQERHLSGSAADSAVPASESVDVSAAAHPAETSGPSAPAEPPAAPAAESAAEPAEPAAVSPATEPAEPAAATSAT